MNYLLDSNIIIYAALPAYPKLRNFVAQSNPCLSAISFVEILGYHQLTLPDRIQFERLFRGAEVLMITWEVLYEAAWLRRQYKMSSNDAIIAAHAKLNNLELVTNNEKDFDSIPGLKIYNPMKP